MSRPPPQPPPPWLQAILTAIRPLLPKDFVGQIQINCFKGGVTNVGVDQTYLPVKSDDELC